MWRQCAGSFQKTHLKPIMHSDKGGSHIPRNLVLDESREASKRLELGRHGVKERGGEDVLPLNIGHRRTFRRSQRTVQI